MNQVFVFSKSQNIYQKVQRWLPLLLLIASISVMLGWIFPELSIVKPQSPWATASMLTSILFFLCAMLDFSVNLNYRRYPFYFKIHKIFIWILIFLTLSLSLAAILRFIFNWHFGVESWLWSHYQIRVNQSIDFMSGGTGICFLVTGILLSSDYFFRNYQPLKLALATVPLFLTGVVLISFSYQTPFIYEFPIFQSMSVFTSFVFFVFHLSQVVYRTTELFPSSGKSVDRPLYVGLAVILVSFVSLGVVASRSLIMLNRAHIDQVQTQENIKELQNLLASLLDVETGARGFTITGDDQYLESVGNGIKNFEDFFRRIDQAKVHYSSEQLRMLNEVKLTGKQKISNALEQINIRKTKGINPAIHFISKNFGKELMDKIRVQVDEISSEYLLTLKKQGHNNQYQATILLSALVGGSLVAALILALCFIFYRKNDLRRQMAEAEIENLNKSLTIKLREAEVLNKELESFSYSVSHDLRAPLRAMSGFSQILIEELSPSLKTKEIEYLNRVVAAAHKMSRLIDGILILSKLSRATIKIEDLNVSLIVENLRKDFERSEGPRDFSTHFSAGATIQADESLFTLLMQNLIGNAWKFTSKTEGAKIEVGSFKKDNLTLYYVKDTGAGFDMKYVNKLFGTFQRLHFENEFEGTGIGLATCKRIVTMHGGQIWAEGQVNKGAQFYFYFP